MGGRNTVRVEVVRIDQVEIGATFPTPPEDGPFQRAGHGQRLQPHPQERQHEVARMRHVYAVSSFLHRDSGVVAVRSESRRSEWKPRYGCNHGRLDVPCGEDLTQAGFDKDAVTRLDGIRIKRRGHQDSDRCSR